MNWRPVLFWEALATAMVVISAVSIDRFIRKPEADTQRYRGLTLDNGIRAVLISDPQAKRAATALRVGKGALMDPWKMLGMAHFCEHLLFMGTKKYPGEGEYGKYVIEHGGTLNARTSLESVTYYFSVDPAYLEQAFDRFAQLFISPLFRRDAVEREVRAIDSEFGFLMFQEGNRIHQVKKTLSSEGHDFGKFTVGSIESLYKIPKALGLDPRKEVIRFYDEQYSANDMTVCIIGNQSLNELQEFIIEGLNIVPNKNLTDYDWYAPYDERLLGSVVNIEAISEKDELRLLFQIPDVRPYHGSKPQRYISYILSHEAAGGLSAHLKDKGLISSMNVYIDTQVRGFGFAEVTFVLTDTGRSHVEEMTTAFFQYLQFVQRVGPQESFYNEIRKLAKLEFEFKERDDVQTTSYTLVENIARFTLSGVLSSAYLFSKYDPEPIHKILSYLRPDNFIMFRISKQFNATLDLVEHWFNTSYSVTKLPQSFLSSLENVTEVDGFRFPSPNPYIPDEVSLKERDKKSHKYPIVISSSILSRVWYWQDNEYMSVNAKLLIKISSIHANLDTFYSALNELLTVVLEDALLQEFYAARKAGLVYSFNSDYYGISISISGFSEKMAEFANDFIRSVASFKVNATKFNILKARYVQTLEDYNIQTAASQNHAALKWLLVHNSWTIPEKLKVIEGIDANMLTDYVERFFTQHHVEILWAGNVARNEVLTTTKDIIQLLNNRATLPLAIVSKRRTVLLPSGTSLYTRSHSVDPDSSILIYHQCNIFSAKNDLTTALLRLFMVHDFFETIRTQQQLGYIASTRHSVLPNVNGMQFLIQSDQDPWFVISRVDQFLLRTADRIDTLDEEEFQRFKSSLASRRFEEPRSSFKLIDRFWNEIITQRYNFDKVEQEKQVIDSITRADLHDLFLNCLSSQQLSRRRLILFSVGKNAMASGFSHQQSCKRENVTCIDEIKGYSSTQFLHPAAEQQQTETEYNNET